MKNEPVMWVLATLAVALFLSAPVSGQMDHGGSMTNTHNDLTVVQGDAENPDGIDAGFGGLFVKEVISFASTDPDSVPDYGVVYMDPALVGYVNNPIVVRYVHDYTIANFTLQLINATDDWVGNLTGYTTTSATLRPGYELGEEGPDQPHPKVNATYLWQVWSVSEQDRQIVGEFGGEVTTGIYNDTVLDWSDLELPGIGPNRYEADSSDLARMTIEAELEDHPSLSEGWYRFRLGDQVFEYGVNMTIEVRYSGAMDGDRGVINKLIFTPRTIHVDVYHKGDMEILMYDNVDGEGSQVSPTSVSGGHGEPTRFTYQSTFSLVIQEEGVGETEWAQYGRYALLAVLIIALMVLVLWTGRGGDGRRADDAEEEDPETAERRAELTARKAAILEEIRELDRRHDEGELGEGVWKRKRTSLKNRAKDVMRQMDELGGVPSPPEGDDEEKDQLPDIEDLERKKERVLERIRELDTSHEDGEVGEDEWRKERKALKAEAVEIMRLIGELDED